MELSAEQAAVRDLVREFAIEEVRPLAREADRTQTFPEGVWDGLANIDLTGLTVPEEYGGYDADRLTYAVVNEQLAYGMLAVATALSVHCLVTTCIAEFGDRPLRERWLPEMVDGRPVGAFALSEPDAGSNPAEMTTAARREGDEYVLNGKKQWVTNGERAGVVVVFAKTDRDDPGSVTQFLVPKDADGLSVDKKEDKLGLRASDTTALLFDDVRIPAENRLTAEGRGLSAALSVLTGGRIGIAAQAVGLAAAALDEAIDYAGEREQFGRPIGEFQAIRHSRHDAGEPAAAAASMAKYFAGEGAVDVAGEAVQIHGGYGYTTDVPVERFYRDAKVTTIYEGTTEIQKKVIARELLD
ncbi:acyl-CoA dehydrogenase [Halobacteriales archaeon QS_1_68_17]|nr:MAG: acyl-CoA dehydrogenase [Halobacteriales archaeon QS_1_68_17]